LAVKVALVSTKIDTHAAIVLVFWDLTEELTPPADGQETLVAGER
jgi:hypothetical protein